MSGTDAQVLPPEEPVLDVHEIQGNVLPGFMKPYMIVAALEIRQPGSARQWISETLPHVTTLADAMRSRLAVRALRTLRPSAAVRGAVPKGVDDAWLNLGFSFAGLRKLADDRPRLAADLNEFEDEAFKLGLAARSTLLGDPTVPDAEGHASRWVFGGRGNEADVLLIVAADQLKRAEGLYDEVLGTARARGLEVLHEQPAAKFDTIGAEHFGFQDGISQPGVRGRMSDVPDDFLSHRQIDPNLTPDTWLYGLPGQLLVWPGEFVFGYPGASADPLVAGPVKRPGPAWSANGSFLVCRRLQQDVAGFWAWVGAEAERVRNELGFEDWTAKRLAAALVGRWESGAPLVRAPTADDEALGADRLANNAFGYAVPAGELRLLDGTTTKGPWQQAVADPVGLTCPLASHIRKVHSRESANDLGASRAALDRRILRHGLPYGRPLEKGAQSDPENGNRGLMFLSYQTSITDQFEFLCTSWMGNPVNPRSPSGFDMVVGQNGHPGQNRRRHATLFSAAMMTTQVSATAEFVVPTGGGYFFSPSMSAMGETLAAT